MVTCTLISALGKANLVYIVSLGHPGYIMRACLKKQNLTPNHDSIRSVAVGRKGV